MQGFRHIEKAALPGPVKMSGRALALTALMLAALLLPFPQRARAGVYPWTGGHDAPGRSGPTEVTYFAEGTTRNGFEEYLVLRNPGAKAARVTVAYLFPPPEESVTRQLVLAPGAGGSICVNDVVGPGRDVSVVIVAEPGIIAEREMYFNYRGVWTGGDLTTGVSSPSKTWYFAEGTTRKGFQEWICLQNPSDTDVAATLTFMLGTGENIKQRVIVGAHSRKTVDVNAAIGPEKDTSVKVQAGKPVVAERPVYFDYKGAWTGGHTVVGSTGLGRTWYFAEGTTRRGFEEWLCLMNPGPETTARLEYMFTDGQSEVRTYTLRANARTTLSVNDEVGPEKDVSVSVRSGGDILCERPMYFNYRDSIDGGHTVLGSTSGAKSWYFSTAATGPGFESWLCLMNPGTERASVKVELLGDGGERHTDALLMEPNARATVNLNAFSLGLASPWVRVKATAKIVVERPSYFSYEPRVEPEPFTFATWNGLELKCPVRYSDLLGCIFHEVAASASDGQPSNAQVLQPAGTCMRDDNPARRYPAVTTGASGDPAYFVEDSRGRGTYSTTACDVQSKAGAAVLSPVNGTVLAAEGYMLYGSYPDLRVLISIDGYPGYHLAALHMSSVAVSRGQRVQAGKTVIGTVRDLVPYFNSGPNQYTREEGNHTHVQVNYRPDMGSGLEARSGIEAGPDTAFVFFAGYGHLQTREMSLRPRSLFLSLLPIRTGSPVEQTSTSRDRRASL